MKGNLHISNYLNQVLRDWQGSRGEFPNNTIQGSVWPVPFFGNPTTAIIATVGVNPSSGEFAPDRRWGEVGQGRDLRGLLLKNSARLNPSLYFAPCDSATPATSLWVAASRVREPNRPVA